jgi:hypothetical protein
MLIGIVVICDEVSAESTFVNVVFVLRGERQVLYLKSKKFDYVLS